MKSPGVPSSPEPSEERLYFNVACPDLFQRGFPVRIHSWTDLVTCHSNDRLPWKHPGGCRKTQAFPPRTRLPWDPPEGAVTYKLPAIEFPRRESSTGIRSLSASSFFHFFQVGKLERMLGDKTGRIQGPLERFGIRSRETRPVLFRKRVPQQERPRSFRQLSPGSSTSKPRKPKQCTPFHAHFPSGVSDWKLLPRGTTTAWSGGPRSSTSWSFR